MGVVLEMGDGDEQRIQISSVYLSCLLATLQQLQAVEVIEKLMVANPSLAALDADRPCSVTLDELIHSYLFAEQAIGERAGLSIRMGKNLKVSSHGGLSNLLISAPDLRCAIESLVPFYQLRAPFLKLTLQESHQRATATIDFTFMGNTPLERIVAGMLAGVALNTLRFYGLDTREAVEIYLAQFNHAHTALFEELFAITPRRGEHTFAITFPRPYLEAASPLADRELFALAVGNCERLAQQVAAPPPASLSATVKAMIAENPGEDWSQERIAGRLHMSPATLRRRFSREGASFKAVVSSAKMEVAKELLLASDEQITAISHRLGFSDASNFSAVFKRHSGLSPRAFRAKFLGK